MRASPEKCGRRVEALTGTSDYVSRDVSATVMHITRVLRVQAAECPRG